MTNAPERIWAWTELDVDGSMWGTVQKFWISNPDVRTGEETEYIRADLMAELAEALRITREKLLSIAHSEFDGVWSDQDFLNEVAEADAALYKIKETTK